MSPFPRLSNPTNLPLQRPTYPPMICTTFIQISHTGGHQSQFHLPCHVYMPSSKTGSRRLLPAPTDCTKWHNLSGGVSIAPSSVFGGLSNLSNGIVFLVFHERCSFVVFRWGTFCGPFSCLFFTGYSSDRPIKSRSVLVSITEALP